MSATAMQRQVETGEIIRRAETSEWVWRDDEQKQRAFSAAAQSMICFLLYGEEVVRDVRAGDVESGGVGISTFSKLPIPMVCRPSDGEPRRGHPAPVSSDRGCLRGPSVFRSGGGIHAGFLGGSIRGSGL